MRFRNCQLLLSIFARLRYNQFNVLHNLISKLNNFFVTNKKPVSAALAVLMSAMLACSLAMMYVFHVTHDTYVLLNCIVYSIVMFFSLLLFLCCVDVEYSSDRKSKFFITMLVVSHFACFCSSCVNVMNGHEHFVNYIYLTNTLNFVFNLVVISVFGFYYKEFYQLNKKANIIFSIGTVIYAGIFVLLVILNLFTGIFFYVDDNFICRYPYSYVVVDVYFTAWYIFNAFHIIKSKNTIKMKLSLLSYGIFFVIFTTFDMIFVFSNYSENLASLAPFSSLACLFIIFCNVYVERGRELIRQKAEQTELRSAIMISQIQPHFLYNSLAVISALCVKNPMMARNATDTFADYLRQNMNSIDRKTPVPFSAELEHVKSYVWLEQLRFHDKLNIEYNIEATEFFVPSLSIQPIVENAIRHGICKNTAGGKVVISTKKTAENFLVIVEDNGTGFDVTKKISDDKKHIGIENVRARFASMVNGSIAIESEIGKGTKVTMSIPMVSKSRSRT